MSLVHTTLAASCAAGDTSIVVTSATGFSAGYVVRVGDEMMRVGGGYNGTATIVPVIRGQDGTLVSAHAVKSGVVCGTASDWATTNGAQVAVQYPLAGKTRRVSTYGAAGAIALPVAGTDEMAVISGTALAMTLALPTKDLDGSILYIVGDTGAAHAITIASGLGGAGSGYTVATFDGTGQCCLGLIAINSIWVPLASPFSGTLTAIDVAVT